MSILRVVSRGRDCTEASGGYGAIDAANGTYDLGVTDDRNRADISSSGYYRLGRDMMRRRLRCP